MESTDVVIRPPQLADARELAEVHIAAWRAAYRGVMSDEFLDGLDIERRTAGWRTQIEAPPPGTEYLVAETGGRIAGFVIVGPSIDEADDQAGEPDAADQVDATGENDPAGSGTTGSGPGQLYAINLHPDRWARGIGTELLRKAEEKLRDHGHSSAHLWVEQSNQRAIRFYVRAGWAADGGTKEDAAYSPPVTAKRYRKDLS